MCFCAETTTHVPFIGSCLVQLQAVKPVSNRPSLLCLLQQLAFPASSGLLAGNPFRYRLSSKLGANQSQVWKYTKRCVPKQQCSGATLGLKLRPSVQEIAFETVT
jgi:hypothetical protein